MKHPDCIASGTLRHRLIPPRAAGVFVVLGLIAVPASVPAPAQTPQQAPSQSMPVLPAPIQTAYAMRYQEIRPGTGPMAAPGMLLTVQYTGWLAADGSKFDSSRDRASAQ